MTVTPGSNVNDGMTGPGPTGKVKVVSTDGKVALIVADEPESVSVRVRD